MTTNLYKIPLFVAKIVIILVTRNSEAFPTGAPAYNCRSMKPSHTNYPVPITDKFPFIISASSNSILPGEVVVISVTGRDGEEFQGFLAVSSKVEESISEIVTGMVPIEQGSSTKTLNCLVANNQQVAMSGVTQTGRLGANKVTFQWMAPTTAVPGSTYQIRVVVVQSFSLYWEPYVVNIVIRTSNEPTASNVTTVSQIPARAGLTTSEGLTAQSTAASTTLEVSTTSSSASLPTTAAPSSSSQASSVVTASSTTRHAVGSGEDRMQTPFPASPTELSSNRSSSLNSSSSATGSLDLQVRRDCSGYFPFDGTPPRKEIWMSYNSEVFL